MYSLSKKALLVLEDGTLLEGESFGYCGTVFGEVVFNTGMTGYQEVLTDPSYYGQFVAFTYPEIGNTGINSDDNEAKCPSVKGVIVRQTSKEPSNWRSEEPLESWLLKHKVVGISGIDTRALVRHLRNFGSMNGAITNKENISPLDLLKELRRFPHMEGLNLAKQVSTDKKYFWHSLSRVDFDRRTKSQHVSGLPYKVVAIDFGIKKSILERLTAYGCEVSVLPCDSNFSSVMSLSPEGVFLSNGPGDPAAVTSGISLVKELINKTDIPLFGICLGHQILGLALGGKTFKLPYGHRGLNHPCGTTGRLEITSQNHGFALDSESLPKGKVVVTHFNLNDKTVAGIQVSERPIFGVQYHPEASPGPHDADHHFARFISLMAQRRSIVV